MIRRPLGRTRGHDSERGAAAVELAAVIGLLLLLALGAAEYGMAFNSWLGLSAASRSGARIGAASGSDAVGGDCTVVEAVAATLSSTTGDEVLQITIAEYDINSGPTGLANAYRPFDSETDDPDNLVCSNWYEVADSWPESSRDDEGQARDWLQVTVDYRYTWKTGFLWFDGNVDWASSTVMRIEPGG